MATLTDWASRYRWELMLLVGIPVLDDTSRWLFAVVHAYFDNSLADWFIPGLWICPGCVPTFFDLLKPLLLGIFYFHVRRTGRITLSLLWAYAFVTTALSVAVTLPLGVIDPLWRFEPSWTWLLSILRLIQLFVLIWFARQASKFSFRHALLLIVLSLFLFGLGQWLWGLVLGLGQLFSHLVFAPLEDVVFTWDYVTLHFASNLIALWVLFRLGRSGEKHEKDIERWIGSWDVPFSGVALRQLAIRVLPRFDPARGISKELLVALYGLYFLPQVYATLRYWDSSRFETVEFIVNAVIVYADTSLWLVPVIGLTYAVRVRQPTEPKARPTKPFLSPSYNSQEEHPTS